MNKKILMILWAALLANLGALGSASATTGCSVVCSNGTSCSTSGNSYSGCGCNQSGDAWCNSALTPNDGSGKDTKPTVKK